MNPLDWRGPEFLAFYGMFAAALLLAQWAFRRLREDEDSSPQTLTDPYEIAYLRGGENELIRVAIVNLLERHLLRQAGEESLVSVPSDLSSVNRVERGILNFFNTQAKAQDIFRAKKDIGNLSVAMADMKESLTARGLLVPEAERSMRVRDALIVIGILVMLAGAKIVVALERGRSNVGFLVVAALVGVIFALLVTRGRITEKGKRTLTFLRDAFDGVRTKAQSLHEVSPAEVALMAAVFGMPLLAQTSHPQMKKLFPGAANGTATDSGCGSGCGSGSSCGSGGGDGGGGGCGGCGGGGD